VGAYPAAGYTIDDLRPVTAVRSVVASNTLTIDHDCTPLGVTLLGAGPLLTAPWPSVEGLLSIDPAQAAVWFAPVSGGSLQWNFTIPPNLPPCFMLGLQGVELRPDGTLGVTNLTTFGNW
jgi:hypothetical protein